MTHRPPRGVAALAVLALLIGTLACDSSTPPPPAADGPPRAGGLLVVGVLTDVRNWNPYLIRDTSSAQFVNRIHLGLARPMGDYAERPQSYEPLLAESWETSEDGRAITFALRDARWSDGRPVTADDVLYSYEAQTSDDVPWIGADSKRNITRVEKLDDRTVRMHFDRVYPDQFADAVAGAILPRHIFETIPFERWSETDWSTIRIGSGPFLLESHESGTQATLVRNPNYQEEGRPLVEKVVVRVVRDAASLVTQLRTGEIDLAIGIPPASADRVRADDDLTLDRFAWDYSYLGWNEGREPFGDRRVRQALTLAIDRQTLVEDLLFGFGRIGRAPVMQGWWGSDPELQPWPYDPARAVALLRDAGYAAHEPGGTPGSGTPLSLELLTNTTNRLRQDAALRVQEQLGRIGVEVRLTQIESRALFGRVLKGDFDAYLAGWTFQGKVDLATLFGSDNVPPEGSNVVHYRSAETDRLLERFDEVSTWQSLRPLLYETQRQIHEDQPYTFLFETDRIVAYGPRLRDVEIRVPTDPLADLERFWLAR